MADRASEAKASSSDVASPSSSDVEENSYAPDSSESESSTSSDASAVRASRRRWLKSQSLLTSPNALLPSPEPASTSLWTTRGNQFEKFRSSLLSLPVPPGVVRVEKAKGYTLHVMSVLNWVLPDALLQTSAIPASHGHENDHELLVTLGVHVSLFHAVSKRFFGSTWVSPELAVDPFFIKQTRHPKDGTLRYVIENALLNFRAYFISDILDPHCVGVLELVAYEKDPDSKATVRVLGCGWTLLPLFARQQAKANDHASSALHTSGDSVSLFTGSPRVLYELNPDAWSTQDKQEESKFYYHLAPYEPLMAIAMFVRKNELVGALDPIPGLKHANLANIDMGTNPKGFLQEETGTTYEETLATFVKLASLVPKAVHVETPIELHVVATRVAINLRDEIEANLIARLRISRKAIYQGATSVEGEVSARVLKIALHNGRCFRTRQFTVPLKAEPSGGDTLVCVSNVSKLRGFVCHPNMAIVLVLQYTVHFRIVWASKVKQQALEARKPPPPEQDVVLVTIGARAVVPSDGKKLYLSDKQHHATAVNAGALATLDGVLLQEQEAQRRVLHVDLLSGAACRPYSDNTLYTPPDQVAKSLQTRDAAVKDSFAFCDLKITINDDMAAPSKEIKAPESPVQVSIDDTTMKKEEEHGDVAVDEWTQKLAANANNKSVLAQILNILATSEKTTDQAPKTPSPRKTKQQSTEALALGPDAPTVELSRASKTLLTRYGYMKSPDKPKSRSNNQTSHERCESPKKVENHTKSIEIELQDPFKANEIRFHFAAYRACNPGADFTPTASCSPAPARIYFTFQFYNFPPTRTDSLRLSKAFDNGAHGELQTFLLLQDTSTTKPSLAIQFDVDTTSTKNPLETRRFSEYLKWNNLYVDVWDADSLFQLGTFAVRLHELLRQGKSVKKFQAEIGIAPPIGGTLTSAHLQDDDDDDRHGVSDTNDSVNDGTIGRIQLLMSSYGVKGEHYIDQHTSNAAISSSRTRERVQDDELHPPKHRVRARPLVESNAELHRLLAQEGFYSSDKTRRVRKERRVHKRQGESTGNTLTSKEIAILCDLFGARRKAASGRSQATGTHPTRIKCDVEGQTGLLALLSLRPPQAARDSRDSIAPQVNQTSIVSSEKPKLKTTLDHAERLKRVMAIAMDHCLALEGAFAVFDTDGDGFLARTEFVQAIRSLGAVFEDVSDADLSRLADLHDRNNGDKIEYRELIQHLVKQRGQMSRGEWREHVKRIIERAMDKGVQVHHVFAKIDTSGDGYLSLEELERGLHELGLLTNLDGVRELATALDKDHDCTVSYKEFLDSLGLSMDDNHQEVVNETIKGIRDDVCQLLTRLSQQGIGFHEVFGHFDTDGNGTLSLDELTKALNQLMQLDGHREDDGNTLKEFERDAVNVFVKRMDIDNDRKIDYREFLAVCGISRAKIDEEAAKYQQTTRRKAERKLIKLIVRACASGMTLEQVFEHFDGNLDGQISLSEFQTTITKLFATQDLTANDVALIAARFDSNHDGLISRYEFQAFGTELQTKHHLLSTLLNPHLSNLNVATKLSKSQWLLFCQETLGLPLQTIGLNVMPLLSYFGFVDEAGRVDSQELYALCKVELPAKKASRKEAAVKRLKLLLREQGVDLKTSFGHFDTNGDGELTQRELKRRLVALGDFKDEEINALIEQLDEDGSGRINVYEFQALVTSDDDTLVASGAREALVDKLKALMAKATAKGVSMDACFAHFDKDGDGNIKTEELMTAMTELGFAADKTVVDGVIKLLDSNQSGTISLVEFKQLFPELSTSSCTSIVSQREGMEEEQRKVIATSCIEEKFHELLTSAEAKGVDVKTCFAHFDSDRSGVITNEEFVKAIKELPGFENVDDEDTLTIVNKLDKDASGSVSLDEFETFLRRSAQPSARVDSKTERKHDNVQETDGNALSNENQPLDTASDLSRTADAAPLEGGHVVKDCAPADVVQSKESDKLVLTAPQSDHNNEGEDTATMIEQSSSPLKEQEDRKSIERPVRSVSFRSDKSSGSALVAGAPLRRANTNPKAVSTEAVEMSGASFAAARAAPMTTLTSTAVASSPLSMEASNGLSKLRNLLQTAMERGVALQQSFNHFDKEAKGVVTYDNFQMRLRELGPDFAKLSDDDVIAMAKSLDCNQRSGLCVDDFVAFLEATALHNELPAKEIATDQTREATESVVQAANANCALETTAATSQQRPPPLHRTSSSRMAVKKAQRPLSGTQSARAVIERPSIVVQDKAKSVKASKEVEDGGKTEEAAPDNAAQEAKDGSGDVAVGPPFSQQGGMANFDCNYTFSSNPEIRTVELKLRQTALDAYQRGILPLRVVSKFLEEADDRRGRVPGGHERSRKQRNELLRVEFLQVLMELGFTLLSDHDEDDGVMESHGGLPQRATKMNDHLYARQLERLSRYRHHIKDEEAKAHKQLVRAAAKTKKYPYHDNQQANDSLGRFHEEKNQLLRVLSYYRDGHKKSLVYSLLRQQVTTSLTLFPSFGDLLFFELPFTNPYKHHDRFQLKILRPSAQDIALVLDLEIVRNSDEWTFYRDQLPLAFGCMTSTTAKIENEMIDDQDEVVMESHDRIHIPMRLRWLDSTSSKFTRAHEDKKSAPIPVSVVIKSCSHGHTVALFSLELQPQPFVCHRVLRFSHPASSIWRWKLRYPRGKFFVCMDPNVAIELLRNGKDDATNSGLVSLKCRVGDYPSLESFFVVLYNDKYYAQVFEVWQLRIQSKLRVDIHAILGQSVRHELVIKGDGEGASGEAMKRHVRCFTPQEHCNHVQFRPAQVFALIPQALNRIDFAFCALEKRAGTHMVVLVNLVDVKTHELVGAWSIHVTLALPNITKTYELRLPMNRAAQKKIAYSNPWDQPQTIVLRSSAPKLLVPREPVLQLPSNGQVFLRLAFAARNYSTAIAQDVYLFVNDKYTDQNEECLLFQVTYD